MPRPKPRTSVYGVFPILGFVLMGLTIGAIFKWGIKPYQKEYPTKYTGSAPIRYNPEPEAPSKGLFEEVKTSPQGEEPKKEETPAPEGKAETAPAPEKGEPKKDEKAAPKEEKAPPKEEKKAAKEDTKAPEGEKKEAAAEKGKKE